MNVSTQAEVIDALDNVQRKRGWLLMVSPRFHDRVDRIIEAVPDAIRGQVPNSDLRFVFALFADCGRRRWHALAFDSDPNIRTDPGIYFALTDRGPEHDFEADTAFLDEGLSAGYEDDLWHDGDPFDGSPTLSPDREVER